MKKIKKDSLGDRMKSYESINRQHLIPKIPTIIRLDGKAFHTYTKQFIRPFDDKLIEAMDETAIYLCSKIQGAKFAYVQSDEISIYISDMDNIESQMWYDGNIQKITSVSASLATSKFNQIRYIQAMGRVINVPLINVQQLEQMLLAEFDSRVFQLPNKEEVLNCFLWRQQDATRNSILSVAQTKFSHTEMHGKSTNELQEMMFAKDNTNWNDFDPKLKRGRFIERITYVNDLAIHKLDNEMYISYSDYIIDTANVTQPIEVFKFKSDDVIRSKWKSVSCPIFSQDKGFLLNKM